MGEAMEDRRPDIERAELMWARSRMLCGDCAAYHGSRPYLRLARSIGATEAATSVWERMRRLVDAGARRVLVTGADDDANIRKIMRAIGDVPDIAVEVIDLCPTPLAMIRDAEFGADPRLITRCADLLGPIDGEKVDIVFTDRLIGFIGAERQIELLRRFRSRMRLGASLMLVDAVDSTLAPDATSDAYVAMILGRLAAQGVRLPEPREHFLAAVRGFADQRTAFRRVIPSEQGYRELFRAAGFAACSVEPIAAPGFGEGDPTVVSRGRRLLFTALNDGE
jgi:hypothetical protein